MQQTTPEALRQAAIFGMRLSGLIFVGIAVALVCKDRQPSWWWIIYGYIALWGLNLLQTKVRNSHILIAQLGELPDESDPTKKGGG